MDKDILKKYKEDLLPVGLLEVVWPDAQQPFVARHAKDIFENFDWELILTTFVCGPFKNGKYHIIDGQHRKHAVLKKFGAEETVPCRIYPAMDKSHASWLFNQINDRRRKPRPLDLFKTAVTAGSEAEVAIAKVVKAAGFTVGPTGLKGVAALAQVQKLGGDKLLGQTLIAMRAAWGDDAKTADASVLRVFAGFINKYKDANLANLCTNAAKQYTMARFLGTLRSIAKMQSIASTPAGIALLVRIYNTGRRVGKLAAE